MNLMLGIFWNAPIWLRRNLMSDMDCWWLNWEIKWVIRGSCQIIYGRIWKID